MEIMEKTGSTTHRIGDQVAIEYDLSNSGYEGVLFKIAKSFAFNTQPVTYKYEYEVEVSEFAPDPEYVGFKTCDYSTSTCKVFGIKASEFAKLTMGQRFVLKFNELGEGGAAAGTSYAKVVGEYKLEPLQQEKLIGNLIKHILGWTQSTQDITIHRNTKVQLIGNKKPTISSGF